MNIILNHKHDSQIQAELDKANHLARTRTVDLDDVYRAIIAIEQKFDFCAKKSMEGLKVRVDMNSQSFPNRYRGVPMSTVFTVAYEKRSWRFVSAERSRCGEYDRYVVSLTDAMKDEIVRQFVEFSR